MRFRQVLHNLLGNAVKFSLPGRPGRGQRGTGGGRHRGGTVRDTGVGMRPEDIPRALEPFQQLDPNSVRTLGGAGLGLPIAKRLLEAHGGELTIESLPGEGTTVVARLPAERVRERLDTQGGDRPGRVDRRAEADRPHRRPRHKGRAAGTSRFRIGPCGGAGRQRPSASRGVAARLPRL